MAPDAAGWGNERVAFILDDRVAMAHRQPQSMGTTEPGNTPTAEGHVVRATRGSVPTADEHILRDTSGRPLQRPYERLNRQDGSPSGQGD